MSPRLATAVALLWAVAVLPPAASAQNLFNDLLKGVDQLGKDTLGVLGEQTDKLLGRMDAEEEEAMGRVAAAVLLGAAPLVEDEEATRYLNRVGRWVAMQSERPELDWRFGILDDDSVNAFATPGGYIFVTRGLFLVLRSEAELAGVLGHEIAHVVARHHADVLGTKALMGELSKAFSEAGEEMDIFDGELSALTDALVTSTRNLYVSGLEQGDEFEADSMGAVLAARSGYSPFGLSHVLLTLDGLAEESNALDLLLSTHPAPRARLNALEQTTSPVLEPFDGPAPAEPLAAVQARLRRR